MIYFIKSESGHVKIGYTKQRAAWRLKELQCACPYKLSVLKVIDGNRRMEQDIHERFKHLHVLGEWFLLAPEIQKSIDDLQNLTELPIVGLKLNTSLIMEHLDQRQWTTSELAKQCGISRGWMLSVLAEDKDIRISTLEKFAEVLDVNPKDLLAS